MRVGTIRYHWNWCQKIHTYELSYSPLSIWRALNYTGCMLTHCPLLWTYRRTTWMWRRQRLHNAVNLHVGLLIGEQWENTACGKSVLFTVTLIQSLRRAVPLYHYATHKAMVIYLEGGGGRAMIKIICACHVSYLLWPWGGVSNQFEEPFKVYSYTQVMLYRSSNLFILSPVYLLVVIVKIPIYYRSYIPVVGTQCLSHNCFWIILFNGLHFGPLITVIPGHAWGHSFPENIYPFISNI